MAVSLKTVNEILSLNKDGWRPYNNQPEGYVYEELGCSQYKKNRPAWFVKGDKFLCISCSNRCSLFRPAGFQPPLPINYPIEKIASITLTPQELVKRKPSLLVHEASYCLNLSERSVYEMVYDGRLAAYKEKPIRVKSEDVEKMMNDFDE